MPDLETVALGIWVRAGARDEQPSENGVAHFLEHMAFKGTERRSARDIAEEIEAAGGDINASTAMENTAYYARVLKDDWRLALDVLSDIIIDPVFDREELERERDVILQEIAAANDTPDDLVFDLLQAQAWPEHPLGRPILGTAKWSPALTYRGSPLIATRHYSANRMVVAAAGHIDHAARARRGRQIARRASSQATCKSWRATPIFRRAGHRPRGRSTRPILPLGSPASATTSRRLHDAGAVRHSRRRHVVAAVPGAEGGAGSVLCGLFLCRLL